MIKSPDAEKSLALFLSYGKMQLISLSIREGRKRQEDRLGEYNKINRELRSWREMANFWLFIGRKTKILLNYNSVLSHN